MIQFIISSFNTTLTKQIKWFKPSRDLSLHNYHHMLQVLIPENIFSIKYLLFYSTLPLKKTITIAVSLQENSLAYKIVTGT